MDKKNWRNKKGPVKRRVNSDEMIYGLRPVIEAFDSGKDLEKLFIQKGLQGDLAKEINQKAKNSGTPMSRVPSEKLGQFTGKNHQGVVGFLSPVKYYTVENLVQRLYDSGRSPLIIVLDRITDVRNFGAIARTAECMGADGIIIPSQNAAQVNADSLKTSVGALHTIPVCRSEDLGSSLKYLQDSGVQIVSCTEKSNTNLSDCAFDIPTAIIMGSEEVGISEDLISMSDAQVKIPLLGNIKSLNVSVAAGMILYEINRQRGYT